MTAGTSLGWVVDIAGMQVPVVRLATVYSLAMVAVCIVVPK